MKNSKNPNLESILADLRSDYLKKFPERVELIRKLTEQKNWIQLQSEFHKLKGNGQTLGFAWVTTLSSQLECSLKAQSKMHLPAIERQLDLAIQIFEMGLSTDPFHFELETNPLWREIISYGCRP